MGGVGLDHFEDGRGDAGRIVTALRQLPRSRTVSHEAIGGQGRLWQPDYFDRLIRDQEHFEKVAKYITWNPVKAGLCNDPALWPHSSGNPRFFGAIPTD